jgi:hypothetical protein
VSWIIAGFQLADKPGGLEITMSRQRRIPGFKQSIGAVLRAKSGQHSRLAVEVAIFYYHGVIAGNSSLVLRDRVAQTPPLLHL